MSFRSFREIKNWFLALFRRDTMQDEFDTEMEQHLEFIDAAAAHMSAYDDNPRAQARAILGTRGRQSHSHILDPKPLARWWLQHSTVECLR